MTSHAASGAPSPLAPLVDERRLGSAGGQAAIGIAGIVLAVILVMGQISIATSKGMAMHLSSSVDNITEANKVMESVIERAAPSVELEKVLDQQSQTLADTRDSMVVTNDELATIIDAKHRLIRIVGGMQSTSDQLASNVGSLRSSTSTMTSELGTLPAATTNTHKQLQRINTDTNAINGELGAIGQKMMSYGLPHAQGAPTG
ncbi:MAG: hypothetical protein KDC46_01470 [Thermoleophilia bacterium]|nr:hypothetical protein [Thermoleophilia bacterium]